MKLQRTWLLLLGAVLTGCADKPMPVAEKPNLAVEDSQPVAKDPKPEMEDAKEAQRKCSERFGLPIEITNSIGMKLKLIPVGEFMMGSPESDDDAWQNPRHKVRITKPFYLGVYEVTQAEYEEVTGENPSTFNGAGNPVEQVSWNDATEFCKKLSAKEENTYRLPTEAEWEYACRAGTTTRFSFGDDPASLGEYAWHKDNSGGKTHPVGEKKPNTLGLFDVHGNVAEWCVDSWGANRVRRGGCWGSTAKYCESSKRRRSIPEGRYDFQGFRVVAVPSGNDQ